MWILHTPIDSENSLLAINVIGYYSNVSMFVTYVLVRLMVMLTIIHKRNVIQSKRSEQSINWMNELFWR